MPQLDNILRLVDVVFVVTIAGQHQRQDQTAEMLTKHGVHFEFFFGSDFRHLTIDQLIAEQIYDPTTKHKSFHPLLTPGEVGCAHSHHSLARRIATGEYNSALILEDDLLILEKNLSECDNSLRSLPPDWNLLYLGYNKNNLTTPLNVRLKLSTWYPLRFALGSERHNPATISKIFRRPLNTHWFHAGCFNGTHAYAIDQAAAQYLVELQTPIKLEADKALQHLVRYSGLNAYCPRYDVFDQRWDLPSLVGPRASWH